MESKHSAESLAARVKILQNAPQVTQWFKVKLGFILKYSKAYQYKDHL